MDLWPGRPFPLGATYDGAGTAFSVFSGIADRIELCLFDEGGHEERVTLPERTAFVHHGYVPGVQPGTRYGYRVHGPWDPGRGLLCNPAKLLLDPYATAVEGEVRWTDAVVPFPPDRPLDAGAPADATDTAGVMPRSVVTNPWFDWGEDRQPLRIPWHETVIYEAHVKSLTAQHPDVPAHQRGTYAGLCAPAVIEHLKRLGVTAIELLPVHQFVHDRRLVEMGLRNHWGYNSIAFLAPHNGYASTGQRGQQVQEFKHLVRTMHRAGIEVILDVVYNHTGEGGDRGPVLAFKGLDNPAYYRLAPDDPLRYVDYTGTGNSLNVRHRHVLQLIMDSLRYWVTEMHVDGFRFDLASTLARGEHHVDMRSAFFDLVHQDPVVSQVKLIAEPWDLGEGGYQVGSFPPLWSEWNGRYRDEVRDFWRGADNTVAEFAFRFTGSSDLYESTGRTPTASINFVTCHDGFTLADLVSYNSKHNEANGEHNRDGTDDNRSWNCGAEGPTTDPEILSRRVRQRRNLLVTLFLSQGIPMLLAGDELGNSQGGNNNAYAQDNPTSWLDWEGAEPDFAEFVRRLTALRRRHPVFRRRRWFDGHAVAGDTGHDIAWFTPNGDPMTDADWRVSFARSIGVFLNGDTIASVGPRGERVTDDSFLVFFNAYDGELDFVLPAAAYGESWEQVLDTSVAHVDDAFPVDRGRHLDRYAAGDKVRVAGRSVVLFRRSTTDDRGAPIG